MSEGRKRLIAVLDALAVSLTDAAMKRNKTHHTFDLTTEEVIALRDAAKEEKQRLLGH